MIKNKDFEIAFSDELHKIAKSDTHREALTMTKEALLGIKALIKGVKTYGKGVSKGVQSKFIKAKVGLQSGKWNVTSKQMGGRQYSVDRIGRITGKSPMTATNVKELKRSESLARGGKSLRGKGSPKKVWPKMKAEARADIKTLKGKLPKSKIVKQTKKSPGGSSATFISGEEKLRQGIGKFKKNVKKQGWQVAGVGAVAGGVGYASGTDERTVNVVHKSASIGGAVLASVVKQAEHPIRTTRKKAIAAGHSKSKSNAIAHKTQAIVQHGGTSYGGTKTDVRDVVKQVMDKKSNLNVGGDINSNINSTAKLPPTIKTQPIKNALPPVKAPKLKKIAAPLPLRHLGKALKAIVGGKAQVAGKHVGHAAGSVGKSVAGVVKGTSRLSRGKNEVFLGSKQYKAFGKRMGFTKNPTRRANKKDPWYTRGNIGKAMLKYKKTTGAVTVGTGALATKEILD